jgi:hypothetical protein
VAKLHDAGVVVTERDPDDGRRVLISIAPDIRPGRLRSRAWRPVEPALRSRYPDSSEAEIARVIALLTELADILTIERASGALASAPKRRPRQARQRNVPRGRQTLSFQAGSKSGTGPAAGSWR